MLSLHDPASSLAKGTEEVAGIFLVLAPGDMTPVVCSALLTAFGFEVDDSRADLIEGAGPGGAPSWARVLLAGGLAAHIAVAPTPPVVDDSTSYEGTLDIVRTEWGAEVVHLRFDPWRTDAGQAAPHDLHWWHGPAVEGHAALLGVERFGDRVALRWSAFAAGEAQAIPGGLLPLSAGSTRAG